MTTAIEVLNKVKWEEAEVDEEKESQDSIAAKPVFVPELNGGIPLASVTRIKDEWLRACRETEEEIASSRRVFAREDLLKVMFAIHAYFSPAFFPNESVMAADVDCPQCHTAEGEWDRAKKHASEEIAASWHGKGERKITTDDIRAWMEQKGLGHHLQHLENCPANMLWDYVLFARIIQQRAACARLNTYVFIKRSLRPLTAREHPNKRSKNGQRGRNWELLPWKQVFKELLGVVPDISFPARAPKKGE